MMISSLIFKYKLQEYSTTLQTNQINKHPFEKTASLSDAEFKLFKAWLYKEAGIHLVDAKRALVESRLSKRLRVLNFSSYQDYFNFLSNKSNVQASSEKQAALDLLTTNETYFFREVGHFDYIRQILIPQWNNRAIRCWSAASSSGEEAYTLAMMLAAHYKGDWQIQGTDISSRVIASAKQAVYPMSRSKNISTQYLHKYCRKGIGDKSDTFKIGHKLRSKVSFSEGNLQKSQAHLGQFDLIFLRNVMIYFDTPSKQKVLDNILDRLKPGGTLFIGHAESLNGVSERVKLIQPSIYMLNQ
jgi:chemotaxis protein methyltransferase CheR